MVREVISPNGQKRKNWEKNGQNYPVGGENCLRETFLVAELFEFIHSFSPAGQES